jgi:hypothetical protein
LSGVVTPDGVRLNSCTVPLIISGITTGGTGPGSSFFVHETKAIRRKRKKPRIPNGLAIKLRTCIKTLPHSLPEPRRFNMHLMPGRYFAFDSSAVQYSEICQSPFPITGMSSLSPPRPLSTAPGNRGTFGRKEDPGKWSG